MALTKPVHAAPMSIAPAAPAPMACATCGAVLGVISSGAIVATSTVSMSAASSPASASAARAASAARSLTRASAATRRREAMPVRRSIQPCASPSRSAIRSLGTASSGRTAPKPTIPAVVSVRSAGAGGWASNGQRMCFHLRKVARHEPREHAAGAYVDEFACAQVVQRVHYLAPTDGRDERVGKLLWDVGERRGRDAGDDRYVWTAPAGRTQRLEERLARRGNSLRMEGAGHVQDDRLEAGAASDPGERLDALDA